MTGGPAYMLSPSLSLGSPIWTTGEPVVTGGNSDLAGHGPWMAMWVVRAHREWVGSMVATRFGLVPQRSGVGAVPRLH